VAAGLGAGEDDAAWPVGLAAVVDGNGDGDDVGDDMGEPDDGVAAGDPVVTGVTLTVAAGGGRTNR
jgi:hypothetical protein